MDVEKKEEKRPTKKERSPDVEEEDRSNRSSIENFQMPKDLEKRNPAKKRTTDIRRELKMPRRIPLKRRRKRWNRKNLRKTIRGETTEDREKLLRPKRLLRNEEERTRTKRGSGAVSKFMCLCLASPGRWTNQARAITGSTLLIR